MTNPANAARTLRFVVRVDVPVPANVATNNEVADALRLALAQFPVRPGEEPNLTGEVKRVVVTAHPERVLIVHPSQPNAALEVTD
jgi:hypothetical protein